MLFPKRYEEQVRELVASGARGLKWRQPARVRNDQGTLSEFYERSKGRERLHRADLPRIVELEACALPPCVVPVPGGSRNELEALRRASDQLTRLHQQVTRFSCQGPHH